MKIPSIPRAGDRIRADLIGDIIRCLKCLTPIDGHGVRTSQGPNGTVFNVSSHERQRNETLPWTFHCEETESGEREGGWMNCRIQIGFDASYAEADGDHTDLCLDGVYYVEVDLINMRWDLKVVKTKDTNGAFSRVLVPPHDFEHNKVNVFIGTVKDAECTYSIHCIPVAYKYV